MSGHDIWIAFSGKADIRLLKMLRPGFRHCFALIRGTDNWTMVDPMLHKMDVTATHCRADFDLPAWLRARGYRVVRAPRLCPPRSMAMPSPFTCVEAMKRLIGLHDWRVITPWQLYRRLLSFHNIIHSRGDFMGSLYSKPKLPDYSAVTYAQPSAPVVSAPGAATDGGTSAGASDAEKVQNTVRRTLPETILTSFRGVLGQGDWVPQRKSLLGE